MKRRSCGISIGIALCVAGIYALGSKLWGWDLPAFIEESGVSAAWTFLITIPCLIGAVSGCARTLSLIGACFGILWFVSSNGWLPDNLSFSVLFWPISAVIIGLSIVIGITRMTGKIADTAYNALVGGGNEWNAVLGGNRISFGGDSFFGGKTSAFLGKVTLDLSSAVILGDIIISSSCFLGKVEIILPGNVRAKINCVPVLGGVSNRFMSCAGDCAPTVTVNASCILGRLCIK